MPDPDPLARDQHPHYIEAIRLRRPAMTIDPDPCGTTQLSLLPPVDGLDRVPEPVAAPSLDLNERHDPRLLDYQIDVAMAAAKPALDNPPASQS
jgi:hypothetical protein